MRSTWDGQGSAADALVQIFSSQVAKARECIGEDARLTDKEVHNARKALKRARSTLRLLRPALTSDIFEQTNFALRDTGQPLSHLRDSRIIQDSLDTLRKHFGDLTQQLDLRELETALHSQCVQARRELTVNSARFHELRRTLSTIEAEAKHWHLERDGWKLLGSALRRIYRHARVAYARVQEANSDGRLHEWRKQIKHLGHALQILTPMHPGHLGELADQANTLTEYLGEDHDLAVLGKYLHDSVVDADEESLDVLERLVQRRRADLQERAFRVGERLLNLKTQRFLKQMKQCYMNSEVAEPRSGENDQRIPRKKHQAQEAPLRTQ
ncbi:MAG: CHAD domain-containing protein [Povalibacter sp.]